MLRNAYWAKTDEVDVLELSTGDALRRAATHLPDRVALIETAPDEMESIVAADTTDRRWTYAELLDDAQACAQWLLSKFEPGEHICLWAPNVPEWVIIQYGAAMAGLVLVTANPALRENELRHVLKESRSVALIHVAAFRGSDMNGVAKRVADEIRERIVLHRFADILGPYPGSAALPDVSPESPAQIQFTSGTSGKPKGTLLRHKSLVTNSAMVAHRIGQDRDVVVTPMTLFHTAGSVLGVIGASTTLSTLVLPLLFEPTLMLRAIEREKATVIAGVPTMLAALLEKLGAQDHDLSSVRVAYSGGASVPAALCRRVEQAIGAPLVSVYGQTELSPIVCATSPRDSEQDKAETSGRPLPQVDVRIAAIGTDDPVAIDEEGEIQARGYQTMIGYVGEAQNGDDTLSEDGWLRTGDLGRMDERGYVKVTGRLSDMIIRGGENIYPAEVENVLVSHADVAQAAVFGIPDDHWGEIVAAAVVLDQDAPLPTAEALRDHCRNAMAPQKTPTQWFIAEILPMTASGKIQKFALNRQAESGELRPLK